VNCSLDNTAVAVRAARVTFSGAEAQKNKRDTLGEPPGSPFCFEFMVAYCRLWHDAGDGDALVCGGDYGVPAMSRLAKNFEA